MSKCVSARSPRQSTGARLQGHGRASRRNDATVELAEAERIAAGQQGGDEFRMEELVRFFERIVLTKPKVFATLLGRVLEDDLREELLERGIPFSRVPGPRPRSLITRR